MEESKREKWTLPAINQNDNSLESSSRPFDGNNRASQRAQVIQAKRSKNDSSMSRHKSNKNNVKNSNWKDNEQESLYQGESYMAGDQTRIKALPNQYANSQGQGKQSLSKVHPCTDDSNFVNHIALKQHYL